MIFDPGLIASFHTTATEKGAVFSTSHMPRRREIRATLKERRDGSNRDGQRKNSEGSLIKRANGFEPSTFSLEG